MGAWTRVKALPGWVILGAGLLLGASLVGIASFVAATSGGPASVARDGTAPQTQPTAGGVGTSPQPSPSDDGTSASASACRAGDPLANVWTPSRLTVVSPCETVTGVVVLVRRERDGDWHINVRLDARYRSLLNAVNRSRAGGALVIEIVPADQPGCVPGRPPRPPRGTRNYGICTGAGVRTPALGARVEVTGPHVLDERQGWMEIHPVWRLRLLGGSFAPPR